MRRLKSRGVAGFTLVEMLIAAGVLCMVAIASTQAMVISNQWAASTRMRTNARAVVQRNIDQALAVPFTSSQVPALLGITSSAGEVYDDDGNGDSKVDVVVQDSSGSVLVQGMLTRIVTSVNNSENADIRRVTFRVAYIFRGKPHTYEMETLRTRD
jgi:prepilin-type N-terminal cleavage/methylation domain-containing protein